MSKYISKVLPGGVVEVSAPVVTIEDLMEVAELDPQVWTAVQPSVNTWPVQTKEGTRQLYQIKSTFRPRKQTDIHLQWKLFNDELAARGPKRKLRPRAAGAERTALEVAIYDMHLGKYSTDPNGKVNWDLEIGEASFINAVEKTIQRAKYFKPERIVFPVGNDWGNIDNIFGETTRNTRVDQGGMEHFHNTMRLSQNLLVWAVDEFSKLAPVTVFCVPGNHDYHSSYWLTDYLRAWFRNDANVSVSDGISERKYWRYGKSLVGFHHGCSVRGGRTDLKKLPLKMAKEARKDHAETEYHEWHVGHLHHERLVEDTGTYIRGVASLTSFSDAYHDSHPFHTPRASEAFIWHYDEGPIAHFTMKFLGEGRTYQAKVHK